MQLYAELQPRSDRLQRPHLQHRRRGKESLGRAADDTQAVHVATGEYRRQFAAAFRRVKDTTQERAPTSGFTRELSSGP